MGSTFEEFVAEGESVPVDGWDFSWFNGRASEQRPSWGYLGMVSDRMARASSALDIQTGGGEVLAEIPRAPARLVATEAWPPNVPVAKRNLAPLGADVVATEGFPFRSDSFDLVVSRHPTWTDWAEIARVLAPGGMYLSQQIGAGSNRELYEYMLGPQHIDESARTERTAAAAQAAGLQVLDVREEATRVVFKDVAAVIVFLRKVIWTVPDFSVDRFRVRLRQLHEDIQRDGEFVAHSQRVLVQARKPA